MVDGRVAFVESGLVYTETATPLEPMMRPAWSILQRACLLSRGKRRLIGLLPLNSGGGLPVFWIAIIWVLLQEAEAGTSAVVHDSFMTLRRWSFPVGLNWRNNSFAIPSGQGSCQFSVSLWLTQFLFREQSTGPLRRPTQEHVAAAARASRVMLRSVGLSEEILDKAA